jgi:hypothetical protein
MFLLETCQSQPYRLKSIYSREQKVNHAILYILTVSHYIIIQYNFSNTRYINAISDFESAPGAKPWDLLLTCELFQWRVVHRPSSSVSRAPFVTARAEALYICIPRSDDMTDQISVRSDSWLGHQGPKPKTEKCALTPELMAGSAPNYYHRYI